MSVVFSLQRKLSYITNHKLYISTSQINKALNCPEMYFNSLVNPCWCNWLNYCIQNEAELNVVDNVQKYTWKHMCIHSRGFPVTSVECLELWCHLKSPQRLSSWSWSDIKAAKNWDKCGSFESRGSQFNQRCYWLDKRLMLSDFSSLYCRMLQWSSYFKYIFFSQQAFKVKCNFLWFFFFTLLFTQSLR